ncbi:arginase family protein [Tenggerimyces flavus]|uniref:Arginase family protein n=1 Tax=Tenggerimyces flavus TaxID=1708749 RepID=A0ABV7YDE5_9ACTN|nr:arginase family protein [Tenggerimyces flavus]MBM7787159.1 arginase [Tenggerimyces flavus]
MSKIPPKISVLDAPSNLGLRMPEPGVIPGCYKLAGAIRDNRLLDRLGAHDAGVVVPPRYNTYGWQLGDGIFHKHELPVYTTKLADRLTALFDDGDFVVLLGGDCSILFGPALALKRRGRYGLAYFDGSSDLRHVGIEEYVGATAGEGLAIVTGRGDDEITDLEGLEPYVRDSDIVVLGVRDNDFYLDELARLEIPVHTSPAIQAEGGTAVAAKVLERFEGLDGFWVHLDADVLDPSVMPAADAPDPGGLDYPELVEVLRPLFASERCVGVNFTIYDPDLDPDGLIGRRLTDTLVDALSVRS